MTVFHVDRFRGQIVKAAEVYGSSRFWHEILFTDTHSENIWRAMLYFGCNRAPGLSQEISGFLYHPDSRVRAYTCFALAQLKGDEYVRSIRHLTFDPSPRVRVHARFAYQALTGDRFAVEHSETHGAQETLRVLISEDSGMVQEQIAEGIQSLNVSMKLASSYEETIQVARDWLPDLIITDNQKWGDNTNGLRMVAEVSRNPELMEIVLFMLTADPIEAAFLWHGGDYHILKGAYCLPALGYHLSNYLKGPIKEIVFQKRPPDPSRLN
ncbi:MAG: hypothetical protein P1P76_06440 [Anaerolineales bacterium]|nr:hypothetical protein [Anaerolineales bacterium]